MFEQASRAPLSIGGSCALVSEKSQITAISSFKLLLVCSLYDFTRKVGTYLEARHNHRG
jgi:hypothetical protein